jgi:hypothetical protein
MSKHKTPESNKSDIRYDATGNTERHQHNSYQFSGRTGRSGRCTIIIPPRTSRVLLEGVAIVSILLKAPHMVCGLLAD